LTSVFGLFYSLDYTNYRDLKFTFKNHTMNVGGKERSHSPVSRRSDNARAISRLAFFPSAFDLNP
jgi:hypothetical protein